MTQMIVTDLDKTLLRSDSYISEHTISVLKKCQSKGIKIAFATARSTQSASRFLDQFTPDIFIGYGGALALAGDKIIHRFDIPADISFQLISECLQAPEISSILAINESVALTNTRSELNMTDSSHYKYFDFSQKNNLSYLKISLIAADQGIVEHIASNYPICDLLRYSGEDLYRIANRNAVKWNAVKAVAEHLYINTDTIVAFGDDKNDFEMIENCGIGIAVDNAISEVKAVANYVCESNDNDGVARWIERHIL